MIVTDCPNCGQRVTDNNPNCFYCGFALFETEAENDNNYPTIEPQVSLSYDSAFEHLFGIIIDMKDFLLMPFENFTYRAIDQRSLLPKLIGLLVSNALVVIVGLILIFGSTPYRPPIYEDLSYLPFVIAFFILIVTGFLGSSMVQFLCFRVISGRGNLLNHSYLGILTVVSYLLLSVVAIFILLVTRSRDIDSRVVVLGSLYLLGLIFISLQDVHKISAVRVGVGFLLTLIVTVPIMVLNSFIIALFRQARPYQFADWPLLVIIIFMLLFDRFIVAYMAYEQRVASKYPDGVPIHVPIKLILDRISQKSSG